MTSFNPGYYYPSFSTSLNSNDSYNQYGNYDESQNFGFNSNPYSQQLSSIWDFMNQLMQFSANNSANGLDSSGNSFSNYSNAQSASGNANSQSNQFNIFRPVFNFFIPPQAQQQPQQQVPMESPQTPPPQAEPPVSQPNAQTQPATEQPAPEENKGFDWGKAIGDYIKLRILLYPLISPVTVDLNGDGKVSGQAGKGVDLDGDGKADGAATNGDGMLAMGDVNGNGKIDGTEVFGDKTVDPFTGQAINASNGYEAMQAVAKSAQQHTGINSMDQEGNVDLFKLRGAVQQGTNGKGSLGFISDDNVTNLQSLESANIQSINTNYKEQAYDRNADVQHRQAAQATTRDGQQRLSEDLWFRKTA